MTNEKFLSFNPCASGIKYVNGFPSIREAWDNCDSVANMLWLVGKFPESRDKLELFAEECACIALAYAVDTCDSARVNAAAWNAAEAARTYDSAAIDADSARVIAAAIYVTDAAAWNAIDAASRNAIDAAWNADAAVYAYDAYAIDAAAYAAAVTAAAAERAFQVKRIKELFTDIIFNDENT